MEKMRIIAVIPARGGSKGIPRKNMRLINGKPLIAYAIENALNSEYITDVVVSSDSEEILAYVAQFDGVFAIDRESALAQDAVTLDPVIFDAVERSERQLREKADVVITLQPTSPLLTVETLDAGIKAFLESGVDTEVSVVNAPHLSWRNENGRIVPAYAERLNRQQLPPNYLETGAFLITKRECVTPETRFGSAVAVFEVPESEATDIDAKQDWIVCEAALSQKRIVFRVDGYRELGLGHVYRALTLAYMLTEHDVCFVCDSACRAGIDKLRSANMRVVEIADEAELLTWLKENSPDVYIHDCLDTEAEFIKTVKLSVGRVVTFEDLGDGARLADAVVNALYEGAPAHSNVYAGKKYVALRDEFLVGKPKSFSEEVKRVLVMFGGTDPLNLSSRIYALAKEYNKDRVGVEFDFILGSGYEGPEISADEKNGIEVSKDVVRVSDHMRHADLAFSSQGRTTFELASMGVPTIVLAQNEREQFHGFAQMDNGFINLGLGSEVSDCDIMAAFEWLVGAVSVRKEMRRLMLRNDLSSGIARVKRIILGESL